MRRMMWIEAKHSIVVMAAPLATILGSGMMVLDRAQWRGVWPETSAALTAPLLFLAPVLSGLAAWEVRRRLRTAAHYSQPAWLLPLLLVHLTAGVGMLAANAVVASLMTVAAGAPTGFLWPSYLLIAVSVVSEAIAWGFLLGRCGGPLWFAPAVSVFVMFLRLMLTQGQAVGDPSSRLTRIFLSGHPWVGLSSVGVVLALAEAAVVIVAACALPDLIARWKTRRDHAHYPWTLPHRAIAGGATLVAALTLTGLAVGPSLTYERTSPAHPVCTHTRMRICVWPENQSRLPVLTQIATRAETEVDMLGVALPDHLAEFLAEPGTYGFTLESEHALFAADTVAGALVSGLVEGRCLPTDTDPQADAYYQAYFELQHFVEMDVRGDERPAGMGDSTGVDMYDVIAAWASDSESRQQWVDQHVSLIRDATQGSCP